jgi:hypothetical protein
MKEVVDRGDASKWLQAAEGMGRGVGKGGVGSARVVCSCSVVASNGCCC